MDKKILTFVIVILVIISAGVLFLLNNSKDTSNNSEATDQDISQTTQATPETVAENNSAGKYVDYTSSVVADTSGTKLLFFHAPWCTQCRDLESDIENSGVPTDVTIIKVDYDSNQALRQKYGVTLQTTVVRIDDEGNLVSKFVAYDDPTVDAIKTNLL